jgi:hypothetical protein
MSSITSRVEKFFSSPQNQTGLILLASTMLGYAAQLTSHSMTLAVAAGAVFAGFLHLFVPDNTALISDAPQLLTDALAALQTKDPAAIARILTDAAKVASDATAVPSENSSVKG